MRDRYRCSYICNHGLVNNFDHAPIQVYRVPICMGWFGTETTKPTFLFANHKRFAATLMQRNVFCTHVAEPDMSTRQGLLASSILLNVLDSCEALQAYRPCASGSTASVSKPKKTLVKKKVVPSPTISQLNMAFSPSDNSQIGSRSSTLDVKPSNKIK